MHKVAFWRYLVPYELISALCLILQCTSCASRCRRFTTFTMYMYIVHLYFKLFVFRWTDCQQLMLSQHFFQSLKFFDKDKVPKAKLKKLEKLLADQEKLGIDKVSDVRMHTVFT